MTGRDRRRRSRRPADPNGSSRRGHSAVDEGTPSSAFPDGAKAAVMAGIVVLVTAAGAMMVAEPEHRRAAFLAGLCVALAADVPAFVLIRRALRSADRVPVGVLRWPLRLITAGLVLSCCAGLLVSDPSATSLIAALIVMLLMFPAVEVLLRNQKRRQ